jgi:hypothetical protein
MARWTLTARIRGKVERDRYDDMDAALGALERRGQELQGRADADSVGGSLMRRFQPEDQVTARLELRGPGVAAGVDVRGDGSAMAFTGRMRRSEVTRRRGEPAYEALRRTLAE